MSDLLRRLARLTLGVADYLATWIPPHPGDRLCFASDDVYCECDRGDTHGHR